MKESAKYKSHITSKSSKANMIILQIFSEYIIFLHVKSCMTKHFFQSATFTRRETSWHLQICLSVGVGTLHENLVSSKHPPKRRCFIAADFRTRVKRTLRVPVGDYPTKYSQCTFIHLTRLLTNPYIHHYISMQLVHVFCYDNV